MTLSDRDVCCCIEANDATMATCAVVNCPVHGEHTHPEQSVWQPERGKWTVTFEGGPALWHNVLAVLSAGSLGDHASGPSETVVARMQAADARFEPYEEGDLQK